MRDTVLKMTQDILSAMDGDEVGSISDTYESEQVVAILRTTYRDMVSNRNWAHLRQAFTLESFGNLALPTHMRVPKKVKEMVFLNYNVIQDGETKINYQPVHWQENEEFLRRQNRLDSDEANVTTIVDPTGVTLLVQNDKRPQYYTSFDDETLVFDSYDSSVDDTLQGSKFQGLAYFMPDDFTEDDDFVIDLPDEAFSAFYNEAKSLAFFELRQTGHGKAEQKAGQQQRWLARKDWKVSGGIQYPDYGRKGRTGRSTRVRRDINNG